MNKYILCFDTGFYFMQEITIEIENDNDLQEMIELGIVEIFKNDNQVDIYNVNELSQKEYEELEENERYTYIDCTMKDLDCYFINLENFRYKKVEAL